MAIGGSLLGRTGRRRASRAPSRQLPYEPPVLLPSPEDAASPPPPRRAGSAELPRRFPIATPSVPALLAKGTSALVIGRDTRFVNSTVNTLEAMGIRTLGVPSVSDALTALEEDIAEHGCITYDQILCEAGHDGWEGGDALISELESTSWPASVVIVTPSLPMAEQPDRYAKLGLRGVLRKPASAAELGRLFTHLKRRPHDDMWADREQETSSGFSTTTRSAAGPDEGSGAGSSAGSGDVGSGSARGGLRKVAAATTAALITERSRPTPLHITAMGVGMVTFLHVHAGRQTGAVQGFEAADAFESESMLGPTDTALNPEWIYRFVVIVMVNLQLDEELLVTAVVLLERACRVAQLILRETNWQGVLLAAIIVASKTHCDESVWLVDFVVRLRMYPLDSAYLHAIEMAFLQALRFSVIVRPSSFYRYSSEIVTLHDTYCPYTRTMTCDLAHRMSWRGRSFSKPRGSATHRPPGSIFCVPCEPVTSLGESAASREGS